VATELQGCSHDLWARSAEEPRFAGLNKKPRDFSRGSVVSANG